MISNQQTTNQVKYVPLKLFNIFIITTLFVSFFGPAQYYGYDKLSVLLFMTAFLIVFNLGYAFAMRLRMQLNTKSFAPSNFVPIRLIKYSLIISLVGVVLLLTRDISSGSFNFSLSKIGENYIERDAFGGQGYPIAYLYRFFTGFFRYIAMCLPVMYYRKLPKSVKTQFWIFIVLYFVENCIIQGSQKASLDILLFTGIPYILNREKKLNTKNRRKIIVSAIAAIVLLIVFLSYSQYMRFSAIGINASNYHNASLSGMYFDTNHIFFNVFGYKIGFGLAIILSSYLSAGYYGLSLCLSLPFKWTYGLGSSLVVSRFFNSIIGYDAYKETYLHRMLEVSTRNGLTSWNTIFPWLASDFTFVGAILMFFFVAILFAYSWREVLEYKNPVSMLMFLTVVLCLIYVPANNQLFTGIDGFISTWILIFYWFGNHKKYNRITQES